MCWCTRTRYMVIDSCLVHRNLWWNRLLMLAVFQSLIIPLILETLHDSNWWSAFEFDTFSSFILVNKFLEVQNLIINCIIEFKLCVTCQTWTWFYVSSNIFSRDNTYFAVFPWCLFKLTEEFEKGKVIFSCFEWRWLSIDKYNLFCVLFQNGSHSSGCFSC